ncbi:hypothetical protein [Ralstonia phage GP4]|uniref:Uncharacterized protein n=1 Tax=Ralstonia phage GP4 TaxID=2282904 RepID=A0A345GTW6_9CAUD|nr:hypothetical protein KMC52_gp35 [Ralstonia phage GP4]AXG67730.1 hypothetical protein [Ralstonia phage GP4]
MEGEGNGCAGVAPSADRPQRTEKPVELLPAKPTKASTTKPPAPTSAIWDAYAAAYRQRYGAEPVRNAKVNGQLAQLLTRLGADEAPQVAAFYVWNNNRYYAQKMHAVDCLLADAEKLRTEWFTGRRMTAKAASEADRLQEDGEMWGRIAEIHATRDAEALRGGDHGRD